MDGGLTESSSTQWKVMSVKIQTHVGMQGQYEH